MTNKELANKAQRLYAAQKLYNEKLRWIMQEKNKLEQQISFIDEQIGEIENAISNES